MVAETRDRFHLSRVFVTIERLEIARTLLFYILFTVLDP